MNSTDSTVSNGRDTSGKFASGNQAAAGRTSRAAELRQAFVTAVSLEDVAEIAATLVAAAKSGDIAAAKLLLDRVFGKPGAEDTAPEDGGKNRVLALLGQSRPSARSIVDQIRLRKESDLP